MNYSSIKGLEYDGACCNISSSTWDKWMTGAVRADARKVNALVRKFMPSLYQALDLRLPTRYKYFRTERHLVLVHSAIEYFLRIER